jgi:prepilin signal peptidase PulO-like enzyme (type II secretory pathway)
LPSSGAVVALLGAVLVAQGVPPGVVLIAYVAAVSLPLVNSDVLFHRLPNRFTVPGLALAAWAVLAGSVRALHGARSADTNHRSPAPLPRGRAETVVGSSNDSSAELAGSGETSTSFDGAGAVITSAAPWLAAGGETLVWILLGSLVYGASCALAWWFGGLGFGDVKLAFLLGAAAGTAGFAVVLVAMSLGVFGAFLSGLGRLAHVACSRGGAVYRGRGIPIGPALIIGFWLALVAGI